MSAQEFIEDKSFRRWVYQPNEADNARWATWLGQHPEDRDALEQARTFLLQVRGNLPPLSDDFVQERTKQILKAAGDLLMPGAPVRRMPAWQVVGLAASVLLVLSVGWWQWVGWPTGQPALTSRLNRLPTRLLSVVNSQPYARLVKLPDGSLVKLEPGALVRFPPQNTGSQRDVHLTGTAFFEVVKDPARPFFVYAPGMTARVIGTSFTMQAPRSGQAAHILVRTGRVAVYPGTRPGLSPADPPVVLTANQTATYSPDVARIESAPATTAQKLAMPMPPTEFVFQRTPLALVFQRLERAYGVSIQYDKVLLAHRTLTARLDDESLFDKLNIIAASLDLTYQLTPTGTIQISTKVSATGKTDS